jgi:hypothetical protein
MKRAGATVVELVVTLTVLAVVGGVLAAPLASGRRLARGIAEVRAARAELRDGAAILSRELRGVAVMDTLRVTADTAVEFFSPIVTAVTCANSTGGRLDLSAVPPRRGGLAFITPDTGDLVWVWRQDTVVGPGRWMRSRVAAYTETTVSGCDPDLAAPGVQGRVLTLADDLGDLQAGAPVQIVRRGRYSVYRAADGSWYLGYRRCDAIGPPRCQTVQPVAGPYRAKSATSAGLEFRYRDSAGVEVYGAAAAATWSLQIVMRSDTAKWERSAAQRAALDDSTVFDISFRNAF